MYLMNGPYKIISAFRTVHEKRPNRFLVLFSKRDFYFNDSGGTLSLRRMKKWLACSDLIYHKTKCILIALIIYNSMMFVVNFVFVLTVEESAKLL